MLLLFVSIFCALAVLLNPSILSFGAALLVIALTFFGRRESQAINPYYLFLPTPLALLLYSNSVSSLFLPEIHFTNQLIILAAVYAYLIGLAFVRNPSVFGDPARTPRYSFWAILLLGLIPHVLGIARAGVPALAADIDASRELYILPIIGQFSVFLPLAMLVAFKQRDRKLILLSACLSFGLTILTLSKFSILLSAIFFFFGYVKYSGRELFHIKAGYMVAAAVIIIPLLFEVVFSLREGLSQSEYYWRSQVGFQWATLDRYGDYTYLPYLYLTTPWSNFVYLTEIRMDPSLGARTISSIASLLQVDGFLTIEDKPIRMAPFNTHAFISDFYLDFGAFGAILLSFFLGAIVKWSYVNALRMPDVMNEGIWIAVGFASLLLFFSNHFTGLTYPLVSLVLFNAYRAISKLNKSGSRNLGRRLSVRERSSM